MAGVPGSPLNELVTCLCEFLEAAVHTVLASRGLYHKDVFERCKVFNVFTRRSRHPELNSYISSTVARLRVGRGRGRGRAGGLGTAMAFLLVRCLTAAWKQAVSVIPPVPVRPLGRARSPWLSRTACGSWPWCLWARRGGLWSASPS